MLAVPAGSPRTVRKSSSADDGDTAVEVFQGLPAGCAATSITAGDCESSQEQVPSPVKSSSREKVEEPEEDGETSAEDLPLDQPKRGFKISITVRLGGGLLAICAGMVNAVSFLSLGTFVSHLTGTLSKVGLGLEDDDTADSGDSLLLLCSFVVGSTWTGFLIGKDTIHFGLALYDLCLITEATFLVMAAVMADYKAAQYFAACACGLQNGLATHWGGAVIRTTHVTGLFTDVGLLLGRMLSMLCRKRCGKRFDPLDQVYFADDLSKLSVLLTIAVCFILGIIVGAYLHNDLEHWAFLVPAGITGVAGLSYLIYRVVILHHSLFSDEEMDAVDVPSEFLEQLERHFSSPRAAHSGKSLWSKLGERRGSASPVRRAGSNATREASGNVLNLHIETQTSGNSAVPFHATSAQTVTDNDGEAAVCTVVTSGSIGDAASLRVLSLSSPVVTMSRASVIREMSRMPSRRTTTGTY